MNERGASTVSSEPTDLELMMAVQQGDVGKLGILFERHHPKIYNFCLRMTGNTAASEDLVQEIFMRMLKYRETFRGDADFLPWMYRLARNACNDHFRKAKRQPTTVGEPVFEPASDEPAADRELEHKEEVGVLRKALLALPVERREVLVLSRFEFRNYNEIAELLGCSVGAVKVRVHRAVKQLRQVYVQMMSEAAS